jgi:hypothetical protein
MDSQVAMDEGLTLQNAALDLGDCDAETPNPVGGCGAAAAGVDPLSSPAARPGGDTNARQDSLHSSGAWTVGLAKSDPYVVVSAYPPQLKAAAAAVRTETKAQTLNPRWEAQPVLSLRAADFATLAPTGGVRLSVFDYDAASADDLIGCVEFTFAELWAAAAKSSDGIVRFKRDVVGFGQLCGALSGKVEVNLPGPDGAFPYAARCVDDSATLKAKAPAACCAVS